MDPAISKARRQMESIEAQIAQLEAKAGDDQDAHQQLKQLRQQIDALSEQMRQHINAWERTELARHPQRPYTLDYVQRIFTDFNELHGDRSFGDDPAIVCGD